MLYNTDTEKHEIAEEDDYIGRKSLEGLIKTFSLKKQAAIKIVQLISEGKMHVNELHKLPLELIDYILILTLIESLNSKSLKPCSLPKGISASYYFLKNLYLINEDSLLFNKIPLLVEGLQNINFDKKYFIQITPTFTHLGHSNIDPIDTITKMLSSAENEKSQNNSMHDFEKLIEYCVKFNNLSLLVFLNLIKAIPLYLNCVESSQFSNSIIDLACISPVDNAQMIDFLIQEAQTRDFDIMNEKQRTTIITDQGILRGLLTQFAEKRNFLTKLAKDLNIDFNQHIGTTIKYLPLTLAIHWGYSECFEFLLQQINTKANSDEKSLQNQELYDEIVQKLDETAQSIFQDKTVNTKFVINQISMIETLKKYLASQKITRKTKCKLKSITRKLKTALKKLGKK